MKPKDSPGQMDPINKLLQKDLLRTLDWKMHFKKDSEDILLVAKVSGEIYDIFTGQGEYYTPYIFIMDFINGNSRPVTLYYKLYNSELILTFDDNTNAAKFINIARIKLEEEYILNIINKLETQIKLWKNISNR